MSADVPELQTDCEVIWTEINVVNCKTLYICSFYNTKTSDEESIKQFGESVNRASNITDAAIVIGDFNLPGWDWKTKTIKPSCQHPRNHYQLSEILDDNGLTQLVEDPTRNQNTQDLLITNNPTKITRTDVIPGISDHDAVYTEIDIRPVKHYQTPRNTPSTRKPRGIV